MRILLLVVGVMLSGQVLGADRGNVIIAELRGGRVVYEVDGKRTDLDGAIAALRERRKMTGIAPKDDVAIVVASMNLSVRQVQAVYSTLQAYGIPDVHVFAFDANRVRLQEVEFGMQVIPFTKQRTELMKAISR